MNDSSIRPRLDWPLAALIIITTLLAMLAPTTGRALQTADAGKVATLAYFQGASDMVMDSRGVLYVSDSRTGEVHCVMPDGQKILLAKGLNRPSCLALDRKRNLYVGSPCGAVCRLSPDGSCRQVYFGPNAIASMTFDRDGNLLIVPADEGVVLRIPHHHLVQGLDD